MNRRRWIALIVVAALLTLAALLWLAPAGTGEYADSPDKRYTANVSNLNRGTWFLGREEYIGIEIVEKSTGLTVWKAERFPTPTDAPPIYGDRSKKYIQWSPDSRSVSIPVGGPADAVWVVP